MPNEPIEVALAALDREGEVTSLGAAVMLLAGSGSLDRDETIGRTSR